MPFLWPDSTLGGFYNEHVRLERKPFALKPGFLRRAHYCSPHDVTGSIVFMNLDARKEKLNFWFWIQEQFNNPGFERENSALVHCSPHVSSVREVILRALLVHPPLPSTRLVYLCFLQLNRLTLMSHRGEHARQLSISRTGKRESCIL